MKTRRILGLTLAALVTFGCVTEQNNRTTATLIGAGVGAMLGKSMSKDKNKGAAVGAMVGMVAGNLYAEALENHLELIWRVLELLSITLVNS